MPNPYHDETGKFCSAKEMQAAVTRLAGSGHFQEAFLLSQEYAATSQANLQEAEAALTNFRGGTDAAGLATPSFGSTVAPTSQAERPKVNARLPKRTGATGGAQRGPRGYTTGSRQASAAAAAAREAAKPAPRPGSAPGPSPRPRPGTAPRPGVTPRPTPARPAAPQPTPARPATPRPGSTPPAGPRRLGTNPEPPAPQPAPVNKADGELTPSERTRLALSVLQDSGWPRGNVEFEADLLADPTLSQRHVARVARRLQTQPAISKLLANRDLNVAVLTELAQNPNLGPHGAVRLIERAQDQPAAYAELRNHLLANSSTGPYLKRHLHPTLRAVPQVPERSRAAALADKQASVKRYAGELDILTRTPTGEPAPGNRQRVALLRTRLEAARAALIATDTTTREPLRQAADDGNPQARAALNAARGWALQQQDAAALRAAKDLT